MSSASTLTQRIRRWCSDILNFDALLHAARVQTQFFGHWQVLLTSSLIASRYTAPDDANIAQLRFEAFGCAGHASKIKPIHLDVMAACYA